jgi:hypothetical protein
MENIPKVETKTDETPAVDKLEELKNFAAQFSAEQIAEVFNLKSEQTSEVKVPEVPTQSSVAIKLDPQIQMVADALFSQAEQKVKSIYADVDYEGILKADVDTLTKVSLMSSLVEPNARKMANIEKNLKSNDATEGTQTETKSAEFSPPEKSGKVDEKAGEKLYSEMSEKLGLLDDEGDSE